MSNFFVKNKIAPFLGVLALTVILGFPSKLPSAFDADFGKRQTTFEKISEVSESQQASIFSLFSSFSDQLFGGLSKSVVKPKETNTKKSNSQINSVFFQGDASTFNALDGSANNSIQVGSDEPVIIGEEELVDNSYIIRFLAKPIATRSKELLATRGVALRPGSDQKVIKSNLLAVKGQLDQQKTIIDGQQNVLISKFDAKYSRTKASGSIPSFIEYSKEGEKITVKQFDTTMNAVAVENVSLEELQKMLKGVPIKSIEPTKKVTALLDQTPSIVTSLNVNNYFGPNGVPLKGGGTTIGIIDTGVDYTHPDLGACSFLVSAGCKVVGGWDFVNDDSDPIDDHGHGTHVAATAAGNGFYTQDGEMHPLPGIAPDASIFAYKVLSASGSGNSSDVIDAVERCVDPNQDGMIDDKHTVCSMSLGHAGGNPDEADSLAVDAAVDAGVIFTIAAGNDGPGLSTIGGPGTSRKAITVGAACKPSDIGVDQKCSGPIASFSSRGPVVFTNSLGQTETLNKPDVAAPGVNICAAQFGSWLSEKSCFDDAHIAINGTSMATPVVAGVSALLAQAHPEKTATEIKNILKSTADNLNVSINDQGSGMVDSMLALQALGIPNSFVGVEGLPLSILDDSGDTVTNYTKNVVLYNLEDSTLNLTLSNASNNPGVTMTFPTSLTIPSGGEQAIEINVSINHEQAESGSAQSEIINISNGEDIIPIVISRLTPDKLTIDKEKLDFGLFHSSESTFTKTMVLELENRMTEQTLNFDVVTQSPSAPYADNITVSAGQESVSIAPGESELLEVELSAVASSSNVLPNGSYTAWVTLQSPTETHAIQLKVFRGYGFAFDFETETPEVVILQAGNGAYSFAPEPESDSLTLYSKTAGPFDAEAIYRHEGSGNQEDMYHIFKNDIDVANTTEVVHYNLDINLADHVIENDYFANSCYYAFTGAGGEKWASLIGGYLSVHHNNVPSDYDFSMTCGNLDTIPDDKIVTSQIYITENLNQDYSLNENTGDHSTHIVYAFNNSSDSDEEVAIGFGLCGSSTFNPSGSIFDGLDICSLYIIAFGYIEVFPGEAFPVESHTLYTSTPDEELYPTYNGLRLFSFNTDSGQRMAYTPEMFLTSDKIYAWNSPTSGTMSASDSSHNVYDKHKINVINDSLIPIGAGPLIDVSSVRGYLDQFNFFSNNNNSQMIQYRFADGGSEGLIGDNPVLIDSSFNRNGLYFAGTQKNQSAHSGPFGNSFTYPATDGSFSPSSPVALGDYETTIKRISSLNGFSDQIFKKTITNNISTSASVDQNPPFIKNIQFVANGVLQGNYDPNVTSTVLIDLDPGLPILSHSLDDDSNGAYDITLGTDSLTNVKFYKGGSVMTLVEVPLTYVNGKYEAYVSGGGNGEREYFKVTAEDEEGNEMTYRFYMMTGTALSLDSLLDPGVTECIEALPTVTATPATLDIDPGEIKSVVFSFTNNNSSACTNWSPEFKIQTETFDVRVSQTASPVNTTSTIINFSSSQGLDSGETFTKTLYFRAVNNAASGFHDMPVTLWNSDGITFDPEFYQEFDVTVAGGLPDEEEETCQTEAPTLDFISVPSSISTGTDVPFNVQVTNQNSSACAPQAYTVSVSDSSINFGVGSYPPITGVSSYTGQVTVSSGQSSSVPLLMQAMNSITTNNVTMTASVVSANPPVVVNKTKTVIITSGSPCPGDFNNDNKVNVQDLLLLSSQINTSNSAYDLTGDGLVNSTDLDMFYTLNGNQCAS